MSTNNSNTRVHSTDTRVLWTPMHLKELEAMFPEQVSLKSTDDMIYRLGQRSVVKHIEMLVKRFINDGKR